MYKAGYITALVSFIIGSIILLLYFLTGNPSWQYIGAKYILIAGVVNTVIVLSAFLDGITSNTLKRNFRAIAVMLLNIPIAFLYMIFASSIDEKVKIIFINETGKKIEYVEVYRDNEIVKRRKNIDTDEEINLKIKNDTFTIDLHYYVDGKTFINNDIVKFDCDNGTNATTGTYKIGKDNCICFWRFMD
jgi:hypothetical protein